MFAASACFYRRSNKIVASENRQVETQAGDDNADDPTAQASAAHRDIVTRATGNSQSVRYPHLSRLGVLVN